MRRPAPQRAGVAACLLATLLVVLATAVVTAGSQGCGPTGATGGAVCAAEPDVIVDDVTTGGIGGAPAPEATAIAGAAAGGAGASEPNREGATSEPASPVSEPPAAGDPASPVEGEVSAAPAPLPDPAPDPRQQPPAPAAVGRADGATASRRVSPSPGPQASEAEDPVLGASPALDAATESSSVADESQVLLVSSGGNSKWRWPLGLLLAGVALLGVPWLAGRRSPARAE